ncbi:MAG: hypothetical protein H0U88_08345 [Chthoniobacterales bacterium]|nr:hypothetical protein [Chthoniobacterales bacterium]
MRISGRFDIRRKNNGGMFECGPDGLSHQALCEGLQLLVVDRDGQRTNPSRWQESNTYRLEVALRVRL